MMMTGLWAVAQTLFQLFILLALAPVMGWALAELPRWINGEAICGPQRQMRRAILFWGIVLKLPVAPRLALVLAIALLIFVVLPAVTTGGAFVSLANPLLIGLLLLAGRLMLGVPQQREEWRRVLPAVLVLCLTEALIALAAPGADGVGGLCAMLHIEPAPGLEGALGACALALAISCPPLREDDMIQRLDGETSRQVREMSRNVAEVLNTAWLLLLADLALPITVGLGGSDVTGWFVGLGGLLGRLALVVVVLIGLRLTAQERSERLTALFAGVALLLALAGRFAT
ncbi:hypothetical protein [Gluconobacter sp. GP1]|uniref:hypothetical protein n=1 Tax=Gluconobacter sp. GP1 TaxID=3046423 RepID=UPI00293E2A16|nr:hypothetical protein [Gluconobacter sp. GP1]